MKKILCALMSAVILSTTTGCFGEFRLVSSLHSWNEDASDSRIVNNLVFYGLAAVQVYTLAALGDIFIFNLLEFWTGDNPVAMKEGEKDSQLITLDGRNYIVEATKNRFTIYPENESCNKSVLYFNESKNNWNWAENGSIEEVVQIRETEGEVTFRYPKSNGEEEIIPASRAMEMLLLASAK